MSTDVMEAPIPMTLTKGEKSRALFLDSLCGAFMGGVVLWLFLPPLDRDNFVLSWALGAGLALAVASMILFSMIHRAGVKSLGVVTFAKPDPHSPALSLLKSFWGWQLMIVLFTMLVVGSFATEVSFTDLLDEKGIEGALRIFDGLTNPKWALLPQAVLAIVQTIFTAFIATAGAIPIAFVLSFFAAKNVMGGTRFGTFVYYSLRTFFNISRSIEPVSWAIIFSVWVGVGPFAGMLALFLHSIASLTKQYSEQIECVSDGPIEGIQATGATYLQVIWFAIVPQVILPFVSFTVYRWDINVRMATIVGLTGGGGIGTLLFQYQNQANWEAVGMLVIVIAAVVWIMDTASAFIREALK